MVRTRGVGSGGRCGRGGSGGRRGRGGRGSRGGRGRAIILNEAQLAEVQPGSSADISEIERVRQQRAIEQRRLKELAAEEWAEYLGLKKLKEARHFIMPDAPPRSKRGRRAPSPVRQPPIFAEGTPHTLPPATPARWARPPKQGPWPTTEPQPSTSRARPLPSTSSASSIEIDVTGMSPPRPNHQPDQSPIHGESNVEMEVVDRTEDWVVNTADQHDSDSDVAVDEGEDVSRPVNVASGEPAAFPDHIDETIVQHFKDSDAADDVAMREIAGNVSLRFDWVHDKSKFKGKREVFTGVAGPTFPSTDLDCPLDAFLKIWDSDIMNQIVAATNAYAVKTISAVRQSGNLAPSSRLRSWVPLTVEELFVFFALLIIQSLHPLPVEADYFYSSKPATTHCFAPYMSYNRFILLKKMLSFVHPNVPIPTRSEERKMHKIQPVVTHLRKKFSTLYMPGQNICIDESLMKWMGPLSFSQKIDTKAAHIGLKTYELCESQTGYLWDFIPYTGKSDDTDARTDTDGTFDKIPRIVCDLSRRLWGKGHTLVMDNYYNSPLLARHLKAQKTDVFGTLRVNREFVAESVRQAAKSTMRVGEVITTNTEDLTLLVWRDANIVCMISTYHGVEIGVTDKHGSCKYKPLVVMDYNKLMGGVDLKDQMLAAFKLIRDRNVKWYKKLFRQLLNTSILNSFIMYKHWGRKLTHRAFREQLYTKLLRVYWSPGRNPPREVRTLYSSVDTRTHSKYALHKIVGNHFVEKIPSNGQRRCYWCHKKKKVSKTRFWCDVCKVPLCMFPCFKEAHTHVPS